MAVAALAASLLVTRSLNQPEALPEEARGGQDRVVSLEELRAAGF